MIFSVDDIHNVRIENAERRAKMSPEEAERDYRDRVETVQARIDEIRKKQSENIPTQIRQG
jgi:hypothetical protein